MSKSYSNSEEKAVVLALQQDGLDAFNSLYNVYGRDLFSDIQIRAKNAEAAEEVLQHVFMKVWDNRTRREADRPFRPWLYTVARNTVYNYYRQVARDQKIQEELYIHFEELYHL